MRCNKCRKEALLFQEYSGQHLCRHHFEADLERKAKHEIRSHRWLVPGDYIAVALSGDAGSSALLYFLKKLTASRRDIRIAAITVDEGIAGYRDVRIAKGLAGLSGTECIAVSFGERFGITTDEIADRKGITNTCTYCRVIRDFLLKATAAEHGITKLASGEDLDDRAARVMEHILRELPKSLCIRGGGLQEKFPGSGPLPVFPERKWHSMHPFMSGTTFNPGVHTIPTRLKKT